MFPRRKSPTAPGFLRDARGATAVEFALVLAPLIALTLGTINVALMVYTAATLHYAADDAARCASVRPTVCSPANIQTYAAAQYGGMTAAPTFTLSQPLAGQPCENGNLVTATANYNFATGLNNATIPITARGCYPLS